MPGHRQAAVEAEASHDELLGPDEELVAGRRPVEEAFVARREAHRLLVVPQRRQALERIVLHATNLRIPIVEIEGGTLTALAGFDGHQGIALVVAPRRYSTLEEVIARAHERGEPPFVLVLDSLEDPQNVGTLLRSAEAVGAHGVLFPTRRQAPLTPVAVKASAGAVEHLLLAPVDDLPAALADLHGHGLRIAGAEADAPLALRDADLRGPLALVVGSEGQGLGPAVRRRCDLLLRIPMRGHVGSLNAAVAGSILLFEALGQRGGGADGGPASADASAASAATSEGSTEAAGMPDASRAPGGRHGAGGVVGPRADAPPSRDSESPAESAANASRSSTEPTEDTAGAQPEPTAAPRRRAAPRRGRSGIARPSSDESPAPSPDQSPAPSLGSSAESSQAPGHDGEPLLPAG